MQTTSPEPANAQKGRNKPAQGIALVVPHKFQLILAS